MIPTQDGSLIERLSQAANSQDAIVDGTSRAPLPSAHQRGLSAAEREALTNESVGRLLDLLNFTTERLQGTMHRIGYLENQVETYQNQLSFMPEFRAKAARCILLERENQELKAIIEHRNLQILKREHLIQEREQQIGILEKLLMAYKKHVTMLEADLFRLENSSWARFCAWFTGESLR